MYVLSMDNELSYHDYNNMRGFYCENATEILVSLGAQCDGPLDSAFFLPSWTFSSPSSHIASAP